MAAGISIFTLMGSILIDNDKANESISKTEGKAEGLANKFMSGMGTAAKWGAAIGAAAIAGGTALFGMASKAAETTDRIDKLSQKIGISRQGFQEYEYILSQNGTSIEVLQKGFKTLNDRMSESIDGTGKGAEAFTKLGLSATDLEGNLKSQEVMFEETAKKLMQMPEGAEKSALAFDLFGKAGQELMPLLNGSAEGMDELRKAANDMGLVLSDEAVDAGAKFTDTMDNVKRSLGSVVANIGVQVMPMFQTFLDWVMDHMPEIQEVVTKVFEYIGIFVNVVIDIFRDYLIPIFQTLFNWTKENWPTIQAIIEGVFKAIKFVWDNVLAPVLNLLWEALKVVVDFVAKNFPGMQRTAENIFSGIGKAVETVTGIFATLTDGIKKAYDWLTTWNGTKVKDKTPSTTSYGGFRADGIHENGLDYVPFDGYKAILHKNERVLTAEENRLYSQGANKSGIVVNINGASIMDDYGVDRMMDRVVERLAALGVN